MVFNWLTYGLWFYKLIFETRYTMGFQVFFRKLAQGDRIWSFKSWIHAWGSIWKFQILDPRSSIGLHARACTLSTCTYARAWNAYAQKFMCFTVRASEKGHARVRTLVSRSSGGSSVRRAWIACFQYFSWVCSPLERRKSHSSGASLSACPLERRKLRSRVDPCFSKYWKVF